MSFLTKPITNLMRRLFLGEFPHLSYLSINHLEEVMNWNFSYHSARDFDFEDDRHPSWFRRFHKDGNSTFEVNTSREDTETSAEESDSDYGARRMRCKRKKRGSRRVISSQGKKKKRVLPPAPPSSPQQGPSCVKRERSPSPGWVDSPPRSPLTQVKLERPSPSPPSSPIYKGSPVYQGWVGPHTEEFTRRLEEIKKEPESPSSDCSSMSSDNRSWRSVSPFSYFINNTAQFPIHLFEDQRAPETNQEVEEDRPLNLRRGEFPLKEVVIKLEKCDGEVRAREKDAPIPEQVFVKVEKNLEELFAEEKEPEHVGDGGSAQVENIAPIVKEEKMPNLERQPCKKGPGRPRTNPPQLSPQVYPRVSSPRAGPCTPLTFNASPILPPTVETKRTKIKREKEASCSRKLEF